MLNGTGKALGRFQLNLKSGEVAFQATAMSAGRFDLWLVDSKDGSVRPKIDDNMIQLGSFTVADGAGVLTTRLERSKLMGFTMDSIVVSEAGKTPAENVVLSGAPGLMHELYYADKPRPRS